MASSSEWALPFGASAPGRSGVLVLGPLGEPRGASAPALYAPRASAPGTVASSGSLTTATLTAATPSW